MRLISDDGGQVGLIALAEALRRAEEAELDLVEVSAGKDAPVCKIMDYGKFKYRQTKRAHEAKLKQKQVQIKEMQLRPQINDGDYQTKLRTIIRFLEEGDKVKVALRFRGRQIVHTELGERVLERLKTDLTAFSSVEFGPKLEGKQMLMVLAPIGKAAKAPAKSAASANAKKTDHADDSKPEAGDESLTPSAAAPTTH